MNPSIFEYLNYRSYLKALIASHPRGYQAHLAKAMECQGIFLIRVMKGESNFTEDQAFRAARFIGMESNEMKQLFGLIALERASDPRLKEYYAEEIKARKAARNEVKNRVQSPAPKSSIEVQAEYFSDWRISLLHLATNIEGLQTAESLSEKFQIDGGRTKKILEFLEKNGFVIRERNRYRSSGQSLHLSKDSPLHKSFQRERRELVGRTLERNSADGVHFSTVFTTSVRHSRDFKNRLLGFIEQLQNDLRETPSEDVFIFSADFSPIG